MNTFPIQRGALKCLLLLLTVTALAACGGSSSSSSSSNNGNGGNNDGPAVTRDSDGDGIVDGEDRCAASEPGAEVDQQGCGPNELNAACGASSASRVAGEHYQVELQSASGERISFEVFEPAVIQCGQRDQGAHPLVLQGHGFGGARVSDTGGEYQSTGIADLVASNYTVISIDQRGFGDSSGTVRVMDPDFEGLDLLQILDWAEQNLDYLAWRDESSCDFAPRPASGESIPGGVNLLTGSIGSSYGGGYQLLLHGVDEKQRLDAMVPDITWHHLPYSLNPGDVIKATWVLLLTAGGQGGSYPPGFENADSPLSRGLDPYLVETLARGLALNEIPRDALDWFTYHSPSYWCELNGQATMPYEAAPSDLNTTVTGFVEMPGSNTYTGQPGVDILLTQGIRDTLFNFNDAWWNYQCLSQRAAGSDAEVRLITHESGHIISGFIGETPDPLYFQAPGGKFACGDLDQRQAQLAWFEEKLRGRPALPALADDSLCLSLADDDAVRIPESEFKAARGEGVQPGPALSAFDGIQLDAIVHGAEAEVAHQAGQAAMIAPLLEVQDDNGLIVAGIPQVDATVTTPQQINDIVCDSATLPTLRTGCDSILLVGLAVKRGEGDWQVLDDQMTPVRGLGEHPATDLVGVAERLAAGDQLGLWVSGFHPQYLTSFSRDVSLPAVNLSAQVRLPLYAVGSDGQPQFERSPELAIQRLP